MSGRMDSRFYQPAHGNIRRMRGADAGDEVEGHGREAILGAHPLPRHDVLPGRMAQGLGVPVMAAAAARALPVLELQREALAETE